MIGPEPVDEVSRSSSITQITVVEHNYRGGRVLYVLAVFPSLTGTIICAGHSRREGGESSGVRPHCGFPVLSCHWGVSPLL